MRRALVVLLLVLGAGAPRAEEEPDVARPAIAFPATKLSKALLGEPVPVYDRDGRVPRLVGFVPWLDGKNRLCAGYREQVLLVHPDGTAKPALRLPIRAHQLLRLPSVEHEPRLLAFGSRDSLPLFLEVACACGPAGREVWAYDAKEERLEAVAPIHGPEGIVGVVLAQGATLLALSPGGEVTWRQPARTFLPKLSTHPAVPGHLLLVEGLDFELRTLGAEGSKSLLKRNSRQDGHFTSWGLLLPDGEGRPVVLLAGTARKDDVPLLRCLSAKGELRWKATLAGEVQGLAALDVPGQERLVVAATATGGFHVFDGDGTLRWTGTVPGLADGDATVRRLLAGELAPGRWAVALQQSSDTWVVPVTVE